MRTTYKPATTSSIITPKLFLNILSQKVEDWSRTHFILSDERIVDDRHLSNEAMVEKEFLKKIVNNEKPLLLKYLSYKHNTLNKLIMSITI